MSSRSRPEQPPIIDDVLIFFPLYFGRPCGDLIFSLLIKGQKFTAFIKIIYSKFIIYLRARIYIRCTPILFYGLLILFYGFLAQTDTILCYGIFLWVLSNLY